MTKRIKGRGFVQTRLQQGQAYNWNTLVDQMEGLFRSTNQQDWAKEQLRKYYQGVSPTDDFIIKWEAMYQQAA